MKWKLSAFIITLILILNIPITHSKNYYIEIEVPYEGENQPIDLKIKFDNPCYALNEKRNSIKVFYNGKEIESQIYNLKHIDKEHIESCNVVFLSQGKGKYIIRYGEEGEEKNYKNHVDVIDSHYFYQFLPAYYAKMDYYAIMEDGNCIFGIGQNGNVLGIQMGQKIIKMKENVKKFSISSWDKVSSFAFFYNNGNEIGTDEKLISKEILVDGNLMVRVKVESISSNGKVKTIAYYTYYYNPLKEKRLFVKFKHAVLENCRVKGEENGLFAYLMCLKSRSKSIDELNIGEILPYIHVYGKNGIEEYKMDTNPQNKEYKWLISSKDNVILGEKPWFCMDNKESYGLIMDKNASGLQVKALEKKKIDIPGLSVAGGGVAVGRAQPGDIPRGFVASYSCELYYGNGLDDMKKEASKFYEFYEYRKGEEIEIKKHDLKVIIHSILLSRMHVEIWNNESMVAFSDARFRRAEFNLPEGNYVVRIYTKHGKYIGERHVNLNEDKKLHIFCSFQGKLKIRMKDGIEAMLIDGGIVYKNVSLNGYAILYAPIFHKYKLQLVYKGILLHEENIFMPHRSLKFNFSFYDLNVYLKDALGFPVEENLSISLESNKMIGKNNLYAVKEGKHYHFDELPKGNYLLKIKYKNFNFKKEVKIPSKDIEINFPVVYKIKVNTYDNRGFRVKAKIKFERNGMEFEKNELPPAKYKINVYYGNKKASNEIYLSSNEKIDIVLNKNSIFIYMIVAIIFSMMAFLIYKRKYLQSVFILFSISVIFSWWHIGKTNLYILPPKMIGFGGNYGKIISLPYLLKYVLIVSLFLFLLSIFISSFKKFKYSLLLAISSLAIFIYAIHEFSKVTVGSLYGKGIVEGKYQTWGMGIGFYISLVYAILVIGLMINEIRRSS